MNVKIAILSLLRQNSFSPKEIHNLLIKKNYDGNNIRDAISILWDEGEIKLNNDRRFEIYYGE